MKIWYQINVTPTDGRKEYACTVFAETPEEALRDAEWYLAKDNKPDRVKVTEAKIVETSLCVCFLTYAERWGFLSLMECYLSVSTQKFVKLFELEEEIESARVYVAIVKETAPIKLVDEHLRRRVYDFAAQNKGRIKLETKK
jgi:hypothetical protein